MPGARVAPIGITDGRQVFRPGRWRRDRSRLFAGHGFFLSRASLRDADLKTTRHRICGKPPLIISREPADPLPYLKPESAYVIASSGRNPTQQPTITVANRAAIIKKKQRLATRRGAAQAANKS
jgi:hypothetical protein